MRRRVCIGHNDEKWILLNDLRGEDVGGVIYTTSKKVVVKISNISPGAKFKQIDLTCSIIPPHLNIKYREKYKTCRQRQDIFFNDLFNFFVRPANYESRRLLEGDMLLALIQLHFLEKPIVLNFQQNVTV